MDSRLDSKIRKMGVFTVTQAKELGLSHQEISRLVSRQKLKRVGRGIYLHPRALLDRDVSFQIACAKFGRMSAIGGLSALFHYQLAEQVPGEIWILVPPEKRSYERGYRLLRTKIDLDQGIVEEKGYRIVSLERAIVEALKLATKIGERTAIKAARTALAHRRTTEVKLSKTAKELGLQSVLTKYFEVITA